MKEVFTNKKLIPMSFLASVLLGLHWAQELVADVVPARFPCRALERERRVRVCFGVAPPCARYHHIDIVLQQKENKSEQKESAGGPDS